jgi:tetratricopeptide (TPR) repeat protein
MSKLEQLKEKAKGLEARDPKKAIEIWIEALKVQESEGEGNPDLSIYNRIGDLYIKLKDPAEGADYYDRAVDKYAELGFHNNAIAMCNKVLRNAPARQATYLKLAKLYAAKGFMAEAQQNFVHFAERMQKAGKIELAFAALKEFTDISPESENLREILYEHLKMYGDPGRRASSARSTPPAASKPPGADDVTKSGKRKTSSLVFLDLDEPGPGRGKPAGGGAARPIAAPPPLAPPRAARAAAPPVEEPDDSASLEIETTSLAEEAESVGGGGGMLEGLETTSTDFGQVRANSPKAPSIREELNPADLDLEPMAELEPTVSAEAESAEPDGLEEAELVLEGDVDRAPPPPPRAPAPPPPKSRAAPPPPPAPAKPVPKLKPLGRPSAPAPEPPKVKPVMPKRPSGPPPAAPKRKTVVEVPPLELEPDFDTATAEKGHEVDDEPLVIEEGHAHPSFVQTEEDTSISTGGRKSGYIDLGLDGIVNQGEQSGSIVFSNMETTAGAPGIDQLESRVADNPDDAEAHQALGEALIEAGERERGIEELDLAAAGYENSGQMPEAQELVEEILRLDPNSVRHRQKAVELSFKGGDKGKLIDAYLELADTLLRTDLPDKAKAVYQRVAEHDPRNERAKGALAMLAPQSAPAKGEGKVKAKDAKMKVRDEADVNGDFVDLGSMIMDPEDPDDSRDTRMTVADEEPTGDEEKDFHDMLARFKQGIDENIDEADFQSHYDLGVAFKEMGLLDEAIAEFQKALRAPEGKLRTSELLGVCFFEKGAYGVTESILRRGLELQASGDQERLGILYWLGRALEEQGKKVEARDLYGRVFAVDIRFIDVGERVKALAKAK